MSNLDLEHVLPEAMLELKNVNSEPTIFIEETIDQKLSNVNNHILQSLAKTSDYTEEAHSRAWVNGSVSWRKSL